jgi:hypothetical protein
MTYMSEAIRLSRQRTDALNPLVLSSQIELQLLLSNIYWKLDTLVLDPLWVPTLCQTLLQYLIAASSSICKE